MEEAADAVLEPVLFEVDYQHDAENSPLLTTEKQAKQEFSSTAEEEDPDDLEDVADGDPDDLEDVANCDELDVESEEESVQKLIKHIISMNKNFSAQRAREIDKGKVIPEGIETYSMAIGFLSEEMVQALPWQPAVNFALKAFMKHRPIRYAKLGDYRIFYGTLDRVVAAQEKLAKFIKENKKPGEAIKTQRIKSKTVERKRAPVLTKSIIDAPTVTPDGRRISCRLSRKPRKKYDDVFNALKRRPNRPRSGSEGEEGDLEGEEEEIQDSSVETPHGSVETPHDASVPQDGLVDFPGSLGLKKVSELENSDIPETRGMKREWEGMSEEENEELDSKDIKTEAESAAQESLEDEWTPSMNSMKRGRGRPRKYSPADALPVVIQSSYEQKTPAKRGRGRPRKYPRAPEPDYAVAGDQTCPLCFQAFDHPSQLDRHYTYHFTALGQLKEAAMLMHVRFLDKNNMEENLSRDLAAQVEVYRDKMATVTEKITDGDQTLEVESVSELGRKWPLKQEVPVAMGDVVDASLAEDGIVVTPRTKQGRKSNFEKGLPVRVGGKDVMSNEEVTKEYKKQEFFSCDKCPAKLSSKQSLETHIKHIHHLGRKPHHPVKTEELRCPHCDFICFRTQNLTRHMKSHAKPDLYKCDICVYKHKLRAEVLRHKRNAHAEKSFLCTLCGSKHRNQLLLNAHVKLKHTGAYSVVCEICQKTLSTKAAYRDHMEKHANEDENGDQSKTQLICNLCARMLPSAKSFAVHRLKFHGDDKEAQETKCMNEGVIIMSDGTFQCKYCLNYVNSSSREVRRHILRKHMNKSYQCDQCKSSFPLEKMLVKHIRVVHYGLEKKKCPDCNKWFRNNAYLTAHIKRVHSDSEENQCEVCQKRFSDKRALEQHSELHKPESERNYRFVCGVCSKKFRMQTNLEYHMKEHSGEKPFMCSECQKTFKTLDILKRHLTTHTNHRPFICLSCGKGFKLKKYLDVHLLTHTDNKHMCNLCLKAFGSQENLEKHICKVVTTPIETIDTVEGSLTIDSNLSQNVLGTFENGTFVVHPNQAEQLYDYVCAVCGEGFPDVDVANSHKCPFVKPKDEANPINSETPPEQYAAISVPVLDGDGIPDTNTENSAADLQVPATSPSLVYLQNVAPSNVGSAQPDLAADNKPETAAMEKETPVEMYMCGVCNNIFLTQTDVQIHMQIHTNDLANPEADAETSENSTYLVEPPASSATHAVYESVMPITDAEMPPGEYQ